MRIVANSVPVFSAVKRQPVAGKSASLRRRHIQQGVVLLAVAVAMAITYVWTRIQMIQLGYEVTRIRKEVSDLADQKNLLGAEVASLKSPDRLERIAREHFGMRLPMADEIVYLKKSDIKDQNSKMQTNAQK